MLHICDSGTPLCAAAAALHCHTSILFPHSYFNYANTLKHWKALKYKVIPRSTCKDCIVVQIFHFILQLPIVLFVAISTYVMLGCSPPVTLYSFYWTYRISCFFSFLFFTMTHFAYSTFVIVFIIIMSFLLRLSHRLLSVCHLRHRFIIRQLILFSLFCINTRTYIVLRP